MINTGTVLVSSVVGLVAGVLVTVGVGRLTGRVWSVWGQCALVASTVGVFTGIGWGMGSVWWLPAYLYLAGVSIVLVVVDVAIHRLPDAVVLPSIPVAAGLLGVAAVGGGEPRRFLAAAGGCAGLVVVYAVIFLVVPSGLGFGDVKLAAVLGLYLGYAGWAAAVVGGVLGFVLAGVVGLGLIVVGGRSRHTRMPFGPFMIAGAWLGIVVGAEMVGWYAPLVGLPVR